MKSFLSQPLVHFLFIGLSFFLLFEVIGNSEEGDKTIVVNQQDLLSHLQYRSKAFNQSVFEDRLENMNNEELTELIDEYVREEVLYREAKAMGMDQNDYIIKRRMIQKLEFVSEGVSEVFTKPSREALDRYFDDNKDMYFIAPYVTFAHVFFSTDNRSIDQAISMASDELTFLNNNDIPFEGALSRGERFLYHTNYVEREPDYIISHFGSQLTQDIFSASPSP